MARVVVLCSVVSLVWLVGQAICTAAPQPGSAPQPDPTSKRTVQITVDPLHIEGTISPDLIGFNIVYANEKDTYWQDDLLPAALRELAPAFLRFPAGTAVSAWQWDKPSGRFKVDAWDPKFNGVYAPESQWMGLDEYMKHVRQIGAKPLIGINIASGFAYKRDDESLKSAVELVKYNIEKGYQVKHYYIDNEQYLKDGEPQRMSAEQYAKYVNLYADAMRQVDPDIKIIANWVYNASRMAEWNAFFDIAGHNIDYLDIHEYWAHSNTNWTRWAGPKAMTRWDGITYVAMLSRIREDLKKRGLDTKIGFFEWNIGQSTGGGAYPSPYQSGLITAEFFMQMAQGGLDAATFWPLHWQASGAAAVWQPRALFDNAALENGRIVSRPAYEVFRLYRSILGQHRVVSVTDDPGVFTLAAMDQSSKTITIYVLNKVDSAATAQLQLVTTSGAQPASAQAHMFVAPDGNLLSPTALISEQPCQYDPATKSSQLSLPPYSFAKVTIEM